MTENNNSNSVSKLEEERFLPTVIIDMPELYASIKRRKIVKWMWIVMSTIIFSLLGALIIMEFVFGGARQLVDESVVLTVKVKPDNLHNMLVTIDDKPLEGNPPYLIIQPSDEYHTMVITASGYEKITKDLKLNSSKIIDIKLKSIKQQ